MLNLLPQTEKIFFQKEKNFKTLLILGMALLCVLVCFILILLSIKIYIAGSASAENIVFERFEKQIQNSELQETANKIKIYNQNMANINSFYKDRIEISELTRKISEILPSDVYLTHFFFNTVEKTVKVKDSNKTEKKFKKEVSISGFSPTREKLFELKENLKSHPDFYQVYFPASVWTKPFDINFSLKFYL